MFTGVEHTGLAARDTRAMADWYVKTFGLKIVSDNGATPPAFMLKSPDGRMIEILPATSGEPAQYDQFLHGLRHLAWQVTDFDRALAHVRAQGVTEFFDHRESADFRLIFFRDPEGNLMHLIWRARPLGSV